ncbi:hypothetical protein BC943DRAFT_350790 [Umbelopsis sp. AD052]|nr:hypothetical protein BC943DRAFT_350790 [Umbelopsis sp. AD052]
MRVSHLAVLMYATMANAAAASWSASQRLSPRDVYTKDSCPNAGNSVFICSPQSSDTWYNGTVNQFLWNYNNPVFNAQFQNGTLSLYLYQYQNASLEYVMVKNFTQLPTTDNQLITTVDDSWFPTKLSPGSANVTHTYYMYLIASDADPAVEMKNIVSIYRQESIGTLFFTVVHSKRSHGANDPGALDAAAMTQGIIPGMQSHGGFDNRDVSSIHSGTPIFGGTSSRRSTALENSSAFGSTRGSGLRNSTGIDPEKNQSAISNSIRTSDLGQHPEARQSNSVLSSTDALMIADKFRNLMRKPDWNEKSDDVEMEQHFEENDEDKRKRLGNELLRQQLAEEGTQVQRIERRPTQLKSITTAEGKAIFDNDDSRST